MIPPSYTTSVNGLDAVRVSVVNNADPTAFAVLPVGNSVSEFFNVRDFGATGDGSTDDTAAIVAAKTAAGNGTVYFPKGTYITTQLTINTDGQMWLFGEDAVLKLKAAQASTIININASNVTIHARTKWRGVIDGNQANATSATEGIFVADGLSRVLISNMYIKDTRSHAIRVKGGTGPVTNFVSVNKCRIEGYGNHAVFFNWEVHDSEVVHCHIANARANGAGGSNGVWAGNSAHRVFVGFNTIVTDRIGIEIWGATERARTMGNEIISSDFGGISYDAVTNGTISANTVIGADAVCIELASCNGCTVSGNTADANDQGGSCFTASNTNNRQNVWTGNTAKRGVYGYQLDQTIDSSITGGEIYDCTDEAAFFNNATRCHISNVAIIDCPDGVHLTNGTGCTVSNISATFAGSSGNTVVLQNASEVSVSNIHQTNGMDVVGFENGNAINLSNIFGKNTSRSVVLIWAPTSSTTDGVFMTNIQALGTTPTPAIQYAPDGAITRVKATNVRGGGDASYVRTVTATTTLVGDETVVLADATTASFTINLPSASVHRFATLTIKKINATNTVTIDANSTQTIDGSLTRVLTEKDAYVTFVNNGANWFIISQDMSSMAPGIVVASNDSPRWMKDAAQYVCDGVDDHIEIQAAIDAAQSMFPGGGALAGAVNVYLLGGRYYLGGPLTGKSARVIGNGYNSGVRIHWNGTAGDTAWTQSAATMGSLTYGGIEGITFVTGTAAPGTWLDLSADGVDSGWRLENVGFGGGAVHIKMSTYVNAHWKNLRFDNWTDYAIRITPGGSQNIATMNIDQFTMDHHPGVGLGANGFILVDNTANSGNLGTLVLSNGRMESNEDFRGNLGLFELITPSPGNTRVLDLVLDGVTYQDISTTPATHSLVYSNTANTNVSISLTLRNFRQSGLDAIFAGTLLAAHPIIPIQGNYGFVCVNTGGNQAIFTDYFTADKRISVGYSELNSTAPTWTRRLQVFDSAGTSLGYVKISSA